MHDSAQLLLDGIAPTKKARRKVPVPTNTNLCPRVPTNLWARVRRYAAGATRSQGGF